MARALVSLVVRRGSKFRSTSHHLTGKTSSSLIGDALCRGASKKPIQKPGDSLRGGGPGSVYQDGS